MNDIHLAVPAQWISFMTRVVYSHTTLNAIQYYMIIQQVILSIILVQKNLGEMISIL